MKAMMMVGSHRLEAITCSGPSLRPLGAFSSTVENLFTLQDMGALGTPLMYAFREREKILDLFEALTGARMMCNYMRFGGCRVDLPAGWLDAARKVVAEFPKFLDEFEALLTTNEILLSHTQGVGKLPPELAVNASVTGP